MKKMKYGILFVLAVLALVSVASAALPAQVTATIAYPGPNSYWDVLVTSGGGDIPAADYIGWCGSTLATISGGPHVFNVYSSLNALPAGMATADYQKINYVINHNTVGADKYTLQAVFWHYDGGPASYGTVDTAKYNALIAAAEANPTWVPGPGDTYAVILWDGGQPIFIALPIPDIPSPEFPTLALPVGMMIGMVGAVYVIKGREH